LLAHISEVQVRIKEPILILQSKLESLRQLRQHLVDSRFKELVEAFIHARCDRDAPLLPNQPHPPSKHHVIFEELN